MKVKSKKKSQSKPKKIPINSEQIQSPPKIEEKKDTIGKKIYDYVMKNS